MTDLTFECSFQKDLLIFHCYWKTHNSDSYDFFWPFILSVIWPGNSFPNISLFSLISNEMHLNSLYETFYFSRSGTQLMLVLKKCEGHFVIASRRTHLNWSSCNASTNRLLYKVSVFLYSSCLFISFLFFACFLMSLVEPVVE